MTACRSYLAEKAIEEGMISSHNELLSPRFYLAKGHGDWLPETLKNWAITQPHWVIPDYS